MLGRSIDHGKVPVAKYLGSLLIKLIREWARKRPLDRNGFPQPCKRNYGAIDPRGNRLRNYRANIVTERMASLWGTSRFVGGPCKRKMKVKIR